MKISHEDTKQLTVLRLKGELTHEEPDRFRRAILERLDADVCDFVVDLEDLEGIDSSGLEAMLWLQEQAIERLGQVRLAMCPPYLQDVLRATRLDGRLEQHPDVDTAINSMK